MIHFSRGEVASIRHARRSRWPVESICDQFPHHSREEIIEAIDAIIRFDGDDDAMQQANHVLRLQASGIQLINGRPAWQALHS